MKVDVLFYGIFKNYPKLFFELIGKPDIEASGYSFLSQSVKQAAFTFDGLLQPIDLNKTLYFLEVQFQPKPDFYSRLFAEIYVYLHQYKVKNDWVAVVLFNSRATEPKPLEHQQVEFERRIIRIYLNELGDLAERSVGIALLQLLPMTSKRKIEATVQKLLAQATQQKDGSLQYEQALELIQEVLTLKFPGIDQKELSMLLGLAGDFKKTRIYQSVKEETTDELLTLAVPALLRAGVSPEKIAEDLKTDIDTVHRIIRQISQKQ